MSTISSFKSIENNHDVYRGKDCIKTFCESLREHAVEIIKFKKKKNEIINKWNPMKMQKCVKLVGKNLKINMYKIENIVKLEIIFLIQGNIEVLRIAYLI